MVLILLADVDAFELHKVAAEDAELLVYGEGLDFIGVITEVHVVQACLFREELHVVGFSDPRGFGLILIFSFVVFHAEDNSAALLDHGQWQVFRLRGLEFIADDL